MRAPQRRCLRGLLGSIRTTVLALGLTLAMALLTPDLSLATPGVCVGPVCGDEITRSAHHPWQLRMRMSDQRGHRERLLVDCRNEGISPLVGPVERGYAAAVGRRACRLAPMMESVAGGRSAPTTAPG
jgi:hypothetical protein